MPMGQLNYFPEISREELQSLPRLVFPGEIVLIEKQNELEKIIPELLEEKLLGFDTESKPVFKKNQSSNIDLIQLASDEKAYIIRVKYLTLPLDFFELFESNQTQKVGLAVSQDLKDLQKIQKFSPQGMIDVADVAKKLKFRQLGLQNLCGMVLGSYLSKSQKLSNWEKGDLSPEQLLYAATDAWASRKVYNALKKLENNS